MNTDVLIVGAGPTGLALALALEKKGVRFRIIDKAAAPGTASRAIAVQARTLEFYDQLGFANEVVAAGLKLDRPTLWTERGRRVVIPFGAFGAGLSPYPFLLMYPQDAHEALLIRHLRARVERPVSLSGFTQDEGGVTATLDNGETVRAKYICGCDGARSAVRDILGTGFPGGTYEQVFYVADVNAKTLAHRDEFYFFLRDRDFLLALPLPEAGRFRLIGVVPPDAPKENVSFADIEATAIRSTPLRITDVRWFSTYHVHHRVTDAFRKDRAFVLGDAAHIHSPAGGQGMNTGIGDAFNLAWKLADALKDAPDALLDTYATERRAFAQRLVKSTDRVFLGVAGKSMAAKIVRLWIFPYVIPVLMTLGFFRRFAFKTISQLIITYRDSALSEGRCGSLRAGDRLPWLGANYVPLHGFMWQVQVYGTAPPDLVAFCRLKNIPVMVFPWTDEAADKGFVMGAIYLVRPDGHIGFTGKVTTALRAYVEKWRISAV